MTNENDKTMENILDAVFGEAASKAAADMGRELISTPPCAAREGSRRYRRKMEELTGSRGNASLPMRAAKAAACVAIAAAVGSTALVVGVEAIRKKVINYIFDRDAPGTEFYIDKSAGSYEGFLIKLNYVPSGFECDSSESHAEIPMEYLHFSNSDEQWFFVGIIFSGMADVDTEGAKIEEFEINGYDAVCITKPDDIAVIWQCGDTYLTICGNLSKADILKIVNNTDLV